MPKVKAIFRLVCSRIILAIHKFCNNNKGNNKAMIRKIMRGPEELCFLAPPSKHRAKFR
jgi:hypothetical protein